MAQFITPLSNDFGLFRLLPTIAIPIPFLLEVIRTIVLGCWNLTETFRLIGIGAAFSVPSVTRTVDIAKPIASFADAFSVPFLLFGDISGLFESFHCVRSYRL